MSAQQKDCDALGRSGSHHFSIPEGRTKLFLIDLAAMLHANNMSPAVTRAFKLSSTDFRFTLAIYYAASCTVSHACKRYFGAGSFHSLSLVGTCTVSKAHFANSVEAMKSSLFALSSENTAIHALTDSMSGSSLL